MAFAIVHIGRRKSIRRVKREIGGIGTSRFMKAGSPAQHKKRERQREERIITIKMQMIGLLTARFK